MTAADFFMPWSTTKNKRVFGGSVAEWLECWTHAAQKGVGSNRSRDTVG